MKKLTKTEIKNNLFYTKRLHYAGIYFFDDEVIFYEHAHGTGTLEPIYNQKYLHVIDCTEIVSDWIRGEYLKKDVVNMIYEDYQDYLEENQIDN